MNVIDIISNNAINLTKAILLLFVLLSSNYLGNFFSCQTIYHFNNNIYIKHSVFIIFIYVSICLVDKDLHQANPITNIINTFVIYVLYTLFSRMTIIPTMIILSSIFILLILNNYVNYYKHLNPSNTLISYLEHIKLFILYATILIFAFSVIMYYNKQKRHFKKSFSFKKFFLGTKKCRSN